MNTMKKRVICILSVLLVLLMLVIGVSCCAEMDTTTPVTGGTAPTVKPGENFSEPPTIPTGTESPVASPTEPELPDEPAPPTEPKKPDEPSSPEVTPSEPTKPPEPQGPNIPDAPEHIHVCSKQITAPTCTHPGIIHYLCDCGDSYAGEAIPATGHRWSEWKTIRAATETAEGTAGRTCSDCGETETRTLPKVVPHVHSYTEKVIQRGSCTKDRIVEYACSCGDAYREETQASGHAYGDWVVVKEATPDEQGLQQMICSLCGKALSRSYWFSADNDDAEAIARLLIEYINDYRAAEGIGPATPMEQCTVYAKIRSEQMAAKGVAEHNIDDARAAATQLQYGTYVDPAEYGLPGEPYYHVNASEAVGMNGGAAVETIAANFAEGFHNSAPHWSYVGSDPYIAVGMTMNSDGLWFCCIITSEENLDAQA